MKKTWHPLADTWEGVLMLSHQGRTTEDKDEYMDTNLTGPQVEALQKIQDNPGKVSNLGATHANVKGHLTIHAGVATRLYAWGYIEGFNPETGRSFHDEGGPKTWHSGRYFWRLTPAGRRALGLLDNLSPTAQAVAEASIIRDQAMMVMYRAEGTVHEAEADAAYARADAAYKAAQKVHRTAVEVSMRCGSSRYGTGDNTHLCVKESRHLGNHRTAEGEEFTNWTESEEKSFHRKLKNDIGLKW